MPMRKMKLLPAVITGVTRNRHRRSTGKMSMGVETQKANVQLQASHVPIELPLDQPKPSRKTRTTLSKLIERKCKKPWKESFSEGFPSFRDGW